jgi:hypothetical protein
MQCTRGFEGALSVWGSSALTSEQALPLGALAGKHLLDPLPLDLAVHLREGLSIPGADGLGSRGELPVLVGAVAAHAAQWKEQEKKDRCWLAGPCQSWCLFGLLDSPQAAEDPSATPLKVHLTATKHIDPAGAAGWVSMLHGLLLCVGHVS